MTIKTKAIVLRHNFLSEEDKMLVLLSKDQGLIEAKARGVKRLKGPLLNSTEDFCYSDFCLFVGKSSYIVNSADKIDNFYLLRDDIEKLSLASYFSELTYFLTPTADHAEVFLRLLCNSLYLLANNKRSAAFLKPVFELRAISEGGFEPNLVACDNCGKYEAERMYFYPLDGCLKCDACAPMEEEGRNRYMLSPSLLAAMRHIVYADLDRLFQFKTSDAVLKQLDSLTEYYCKLYLERSLKSLDFYHSLKNIS